MHYKIWLGYISLALAFISYVPYFWNIHRGKTKPHAFTWFVWGVLTAIGFSAQLVSGAGPGAWVIGLSSLLNFSVAGIGFWQRHVKFSRFDWLSLSGAFLAIVLWAITKNPLIAVILICLSDAIGYLPSFRKAFFFPDEENATAFALSLIYLVLSLFALQIFNLTTWLYPVVIAILDALFVVEIFTRRRQKAK